LFSENICFLAFKEYDSKRCYDFLKMIFPAPLLISLSKLFKIILLLCFLKLRCKWACFLIQLILIMVNVINWLMLSVSQRQTRISLTSEERSVLCYQIQQITYLLLSVFEIMRKNEQIVFHLLAKICKKVIGYSLWCYLFIEHILINYNLTA
jgi:hypothetical protein